MTTAAGNFVYDLIADLLAWWRFIIINLLLLYRMITRRFHSFECPSLHKFANIFRLIIIYTTLPITNRSKALASRQRAFYSGSANKRFTSTTMMLFVRSGIVVKNQRAQVAHRPAHLAPHAEQFLTPACHACLLHIVSWLLQF